MSKEVEEEEAEKFQLIFTKAFETSRSSLRSWFLVPRPIAEFSDTTISHFLVKSLRVRRDISRELCICWKIVLRRRRRKQIQGERERDFAMAWFSYVKENFTCAAT